MKRIKFSPVESRRFGLKVYRGDIDDINPTKIIALILKENIDVTIFRIPSEKQDSIFLLKKTGLPHIVADTLVYYTVDLNSWESREQRNIELKFVEFHSDHLETMDRMISEIFASYKNHYLSNPLLKVDIAEAYKEWTRAYTTDEYKGKYGWLVKKGDRFIGFAICRVEGDEIDIVLNGVVPSEAGQGVFSDLVRFIQRFFKNKGYSKMKSSTQITNRAVQKVWSREGFFFDKSFITVHINSLMNLSRVDKKKFDMTVTKEDVKKYSHVSDDMNCLYFNGEFTIRKGFKAKIVPAFIVNSIISKFYATEFPGEGTTFLSCAFKSLNPIYLNETYRVEISFPSINAEKGIYMSLAKVLDSTGEIQFFSYNDLKKN